MNESGASDQAAHAHDGRPLTAQGRERKQQLLDAAADLFADRGYAATRIADICGAAGVAKGLFYWYFPTKGALFAELVRTMRQHLRRAQAAAFAPGADALTRIRQGTTASVVFMAEHAAFFALLDVERTDSTIAGVLEEGADIYRDDIVKMIADGQNSGVITDGDPELLAIGVLGAVSSFSNAYRNGRLASDIDPQALATFVSAWVGDALSP